MATKVDPKHYASPEMVMVDPKLTEAAKAEILRQWKLDLELKLNASDENMPVQKADGTAKPGADANESEMLRRVTDCLRKAEPAPASQEAVTQRST